MSTGAIIAIAIIIISILLVAIVGAVTYSNVKPALKNINDTKEAINQKMEYFNREGEHLTERVTVLNNRIEHLQEEIEVQTAFFQDFTDEKGKFQTSIRYLQAHASDYASGISSNLKNEIQEDGPKIWATFKRAFKKTAQKRKKRKKNNL